MKHFLILAVSALHFLTSPDAFGIVGGRYTTEGEFEGLVRLDSAFCSGVFISRRHILTSGHCITRSPGTMVHSPASAMDITLHSRRDTFDRTITLSVKIEDAIPHPSWVKNLSRHADPNAAALDATTFDLGIYTLAHDLPVSPVTLLPADSIARTKTPLLVTGSGCERPGGTSLGPLKTARLQIADFNETKALLHAKNLDPTADAREVELCDGDSGSPSLILGNEGSASIIGINSLGGFTLEDGSQYAGIIARTDRGEALEWIRAIIEVSGESLAVYSDFAMARFFSALDLMELEILRRNPVALEMKLSSMSVFSLALPSASKSLLSKSDLRNLALLIESSSELIIDVIFHRLKQLSPLHPEALLELSKIHSATLPMPLRRMRIMQIMETDQYLKGLDEGKKRLLMSELMSSSESVIEILSSF